MTIEQLELHVIRALGMSVEAITGYLNLAPRTDPDFDSMLPRIAHRFADRIEHIAQYSLDGLNPSFRRRCLSEDIAALRTFVAREGGIIKSAYLSSLPSEETLSRLHSEAGPDQLDREPAEQVKFHAT